MFFNFMSSDGVVWKALYYHPQLAVSGPHYYRVLLHQIWLYSTHVSIRFLVLLLIALFTHFRTFTRFAPLVVMGC